MFLFARRGAEASVVTGLFEEHPVQLFSSISITQTRATFQAALLDGCRSKEEFKAKPSRHLARTPIAPSGYGVTTAIGLPGAFGNAGLRDCQQQRAPLSP